MSDLLIADPTHGPPQWWDERAACNESPDPDAWYVIEDAAANGEIVDPMRLAYALDTCRTCPIRVECGRKARPNDVGIWGGLTAAERKAM